ncbi:MAG: GNAT family N-acetyltransferase [Saprospiraceae bacterium]|nr:GNAT family N-acetyltransferase [Lewinella sp.]
MSSKLQPVFCPVSQEDIRTVCDMMEDFYAIDHYPFVPERTMINLSIFVNNENLGRLWMILLAEEIVGYVVLTFGFSFEFGGRDAFLDELYLKEAHRNQGIGTQTLKFIAKQAGILGIKALHLEVEHHNEKGKAIYGKSGYKAHNRILMTRMVEA